MRFHSPLHLSQFLLSALGTRVYRYYQDRVPTDGAMLIISNHRSFMDAPLLMAAVDRPIRFACHHYMGQVPGLRELVHQLGCFPLDAPDQRQHGFFDRATQLLQAQQAVGVFPEGAETMITRTDPGSMGTFQRGFAHLALRAPINHLAVLPVAIASYDEVDNLAFPLRLLSLFDPSEPLFAQEGWHPMVIYRRVNLLIGRPCWITPSQRELYQGKQAKSAVTELTERCQAEIQHLLQQGCY
ncbi:MAG: 1-acyl-sn-glycerol-3-phosphate acyltransferase [Pantanalinema sp. GBBB05]|nr:1-acyl-sn-glycerol-3-phosphate acyltransferase [Pantanalinema sp. GBBB05]